MVFPIFTSKKKIMKYMMFALVLSLFVSCSKNEEKDYVTLNDKEITDYIA